MSAPIIHTRLDGYEVIWNSHRVATFSARSSWNGRLSRTPTITPEAMAEAKQYATTFISALEAMQ